MDDPHKWVVREWEDGGVMYVSASVTIPILEWTLHANGSNGHYRAAVTVFTYPYGMVETLAERTQDGYASLLDAQYGACKLALDLSLEGFTQLEQAMDTQLAEGG